MVMRLGLVALLLVGCAAPSPTTSCDGAVDCCDATTACDQTRNNDGLHYCRSMNGGPFAWYTQADTTQLCSDPSQLGKTRWSCATRSGWCCSLPGGYVDGACP